MISAPIVDIALGITRFPANWRIRMVPVYIRVAPIRSPRCASPTRKSMYPVLSATEPSRQGSASHRRERKHAACIAACCSRVKAAVSSIGFGTAGPLIRQSVNILPSNVEKELRKRAVREAQYVPAAHLERSFQNPLLWCAQVSHCVLTSRCLAICACAVGRGLACRIRRKNATSVGWPVVAL